MGRHVAPPTRADLLVRYAAAVGCTFEAAAITNAAYTTDALRDLVEVLEEPGPPGQRRSFARSMPTTSLRGLTR